MQADAKDHQNKQSDIEITELQSEYIFIKLYNLVIFSHNLQVGMFAHNCEKAKAPPPPV